jgi:hypothetical protein
MKEGGRIISRHTDQAAAFAEIECRGVVLCGRDIVAVASIRECGDFVS